MRRQTCITISFAMALLIIVTTAQAQSSDSQKSEEQPIVIKAVAPSVYPVIAMAVRAGGKVTIEVKINEKGEVKSTKGVEGHPLLQAVSLLAAKRWRFVPAVNESKDRLARLTFIFRILSDKEKEQAGTSFNPPYEIVYAVVPPKLKITTNYID